MIMMKLLNEGVKVSVCSEIEGLIGLWYQEASQHKMVLFILALV